MREEIAPSVDTYEIKAANETASERTTVKIVTTTCWLSIPGEGMWLGAPGGRCDGSG